MKKITVMLIMLMMTGLCSCSKDKTVKVGSFELKCPKDIVLKEDEVEQIEEFRERRFLKYRSEEKYDRKYLFGQEDDEVFEITIVHSDIENDMTVKEYSDYSKAGLIKNSGMWTILSDIENTDDSVTFKALPNHKEIQDYGVQYYRYFVKDGGIVVVNITVREDADEKYGSIIKEIILSVK